MTKEPHNRDDEIEDNDDKVDQDAREVAETLPGYREWERESRGDNLTFGDY